MTINDCSNCRHLVTVKTVDADGTTTLEYLCSLRQASIPDPFDPEEACCDHDSTSP